MKHILGIDVGGTKTLAVLYDSQGNTLDRVETKSCHLLSNNKQDIIVRLSTCKDLIKQKDTMVVLGYAGYGNDKALRKEIESLVKSVFYDFSYQIMNDAQMALYASLGASEGIIAICGTGSIAYSVKDEVFKRAGGFGYFLEDEGSGYYIGKQLLSVFCKQIDGRCDRSDLFEAIMDYFKLDDPYQIIKTCNNPEIVNRESIAQLSKIVFDLKNDPYCNHIVDDAAIKIAELINYLAKDFDFVKASCVGGVILQAPGFFELVKSKLMENIDFNKPKYEAVYGAFVWYNKEK